MTLHQTSPPERPQSGSVPPLPSLTAIALFHLKVTWTETDPPAEPRTTWQLAVESHPDEARYQVTATLTHAAPWGRLQASVGALTETHITNGDRATPFDEADEDRLKVQCSPALWAFARAVSLPLVAALPDVGEPMLPQEAPPSR